MKFRAIVQIFLVSRSMDANNIRSFRSSFLSFRLDHNKEHHLQVDHSKMLNFLLA